MKKSFSVFALLALAALGAIEALGMPAEAIKLSVWKKGETIVGDDFLAANEQIVDYIATLRRPTELLRPIRYNCLAKARAIRPNVYPTASPSAQHQTVQIVMVYELRDCTEAAD